MPILIWALLAIIVIAVAAAFYALQIARARRDLVLRLDGQTAAAAPITILRGADEGWVTRFGRWLRENAPSTWSDAGSATRLLVQAGFDGDFAPLFYLTMRVAAATCLNATAMAFLQRAMRR